MSTRTKALLDEELAALADAGAISAYQAEQFPRFTHYDSEYVCGHPYFRSVPEYTRLYLAGRLAEPRTGR